MIPINTKTNTDRFFNRELEANLQKCWGRILEGTGIPDIQTMAFAISSIHAGAGNLEGAGIRNVKSTACENVTMEQ